MQLTNYRIAARIGLIVGLLLLSMMILVYVEVRGLNRIKETLVEVTERYSKRLELVHNLRYQARNVAVLVRNVLLVESAEEKKQASLRFLDAEQEYLEIFRQLPAASQPGDGQRLKNEIEKKGEAIFGLWKEVLDIDSQGNKTQAVKILMDTVRTSQIGWLDALNKLVDFEEEQAKQANDRAMQEYVNTKTIMAIVNLLTIGAGVYFMLNITASIVLPLNEMNEKVGVLARGDFSVRVEANQNDELGALGASINSMAEQLQQDELELNEYRQHMEDLVASRTEEVNNQRERFISVLIHDLKAPLVPIQGFARLLANKKELSREKIGEYAAEIVVASGKLSANIEKTSQELRNRRMEHQFDAEPVDLQELLEQVIQAISSEIKKNKLSLTLDEDAASGDQEPLLIMQGDSRKIRSVFENIINNAVKYARSTLRVSLARNGSLAVFTVDDDGPGVEPDYYDRIFEEYYQIPGGKPGTGIGLFSVKQIVRHYQGEVSVGLSPDGGARFTVCLPVQSVCSIEPPNAG